MGDPTRRPQTLLLPPLPYAAALAGGWWLDRHVLALRWDWGGLNAVLGWSLIGAGLALFLATLVTFWRHRTTVNPYKGACALCTAGPFRVSRNPIYVGDWFVLAGAALLMKTFWPLLFAPFIWAAIRYGVIRHEEAHLEARFGDAYRAYKARVRRWL
jgi:protein-S-isoprenylcysteine O-methyltransferase Ste14